LWLLEVRHVSWNASSSAAIEKQEAQPQEVSGKAGGHEHEVRGREVQPGNSEVRRFRPIARFKDWSN
jgi:hypothetical protein